MVWTQYPYTNFHEMNMDWLLQQMKIISDDITVLNEWKAEREIRDKWIDDTITDLNEKYDALVLLYNTFVEDVNNRFNLLSRDITEQVDALERRVTRQVDDLEARITGQFNDLEAELRGEIAAFETSVNSILNVYNSRINTVESGLVTVQNMIPNMMNMIDPFTGEENTITNIIYEIVNNAKPNALTATAYDGYALTATYYDGLNLSAYEYDFNGALYIY